LTNLISAR